MSARASTLASLRGHPRLALRPWAVLLSLALLAGLAVMVAGPHLAQDRCHSQDRFVRVLKPPPAASSAPADSPRPVALQELSPAFVVDPAVALTGPEPGWSRVQKDPEGEGAPGFRLRIERPPRPSA